MRLQSQLWLLFSGLFLIVGFTVYMFVSTMYEQRIKEGYEQLSMTQGASILDQLKSTYPHSQNRSIGYLRRYSEQLEIRLIMLDDDNTVYADSFQQLEEGTALNLAILNKNNFSGSYFTETDSFGYVQYTLIPFETIHRDGSLLMIQEANELYGELTTFRSWMVQTLMIALIFFFVISYFVSNWFTRPIRQIISRMKKITPHTRAFSMKYRSRDEIKELIDATQNMVEELNRYDERQRRFLSTSSHELKTPLTTMQFIIENLPYVRENQELHHEFLQDLTFQVKKMKEMVGQLLQINRIWDQKLQRELINSEDIQEYLLQSFQQISLEKGITIVFELEQIEFVVDRALFLHGIENLLSNAIRYSAEEKTVIVRIKRNNDQMKISVCDHGIGISSEDLPHIFEPFYRSNDATAWNQEGTGLGLAIVKQMVELHKGTIQIDTVQNEGTCFHLILPDS
ncbi:HAMP domain-containing sensor histidine kinase [Evansella sp. AB-P1]|uniref:sensor histidine kinase n=1 Tax=Evansella sp. AB-P1 TaxID=3037653 RepID=UPI00241DE959|nr:HAMP domain-containing sensor histidine kinase [Evansella sp. AB-P1]MDG5788531.1 HAMP domain-containing sensor histidine kinase [Evansella sp. AB-P1]